VSSLQAMSDKIPNDAIKDFDFSINPNLTINTIYVGKEQEPIVIVDDLLLQPEAVIHYAETGCGFKKETKDFYPGIRKPLAPAYAENVYRHLMHSFWTVFSSNVEVNIKLLSSVLSLTTTQPRELRPIQSVPHFDSFITNNIAGVHYLCGDKFGGTSFYRHRTTGFESMNAQRIHEYAKILKAEVMQTSTNTFDYINGDTLLFERTTKIDAKFNRAIFYRGNIFHSANVNPEYLNENPRKGRLTANTLIAIN
jgi:Family of unknown function (DUF6445)